MQTIKFGNHEVYSLDQAVEILRVSKQTLRNWHKNNKIKFVKFGKKKNYIPKTEVDRIIEEAFEVH